MNRAALAAVTVGSVAAGLGLGGCAAMGGGPAPRRVAVVSRCADENFPIYFARGAAEVPAPALQVIRSASGRVAGCRISAVDVLGLGAPDASGAPSDPALAQKRADNVAAALAAAGLPAPAFDVEIAGARRPRVQGGQAPMARRTEVVLHAEPAAAR